MRTACHLPRATGFCSALAVVLLMPAWSLAEYDDRMPTGEEVELIDRTIDLCFDPATTTEAAEEALTDVGWERTDPTASDIEAPAALVALTSYALGTRFDIEDVAHSVENARFVAASVLELSALGRNQVGMRYGEAVVGFLGIKERYPYCVLAGPPWMAPALQRTGPKDSARQESSILHQAMGVTPRGLHQIAFFRNFDVLFDDVSSEMNETEGPALTLEQMVQVFRPVSAGVVPMETLQEVRPE